MNCYNRQFPYFLFLFFLLLSYNCKKENNPVTRSYYFWRNNSTLYPEEKKYLSDNSIHKLYAKQLDIDWNEVYGAVPVSENNLNQINLDLNYHDSMHIAIVPVIFITNKTFNKIDAAQISVLAKRIIRRCLPAYDSLDIAYEKNNNEVWYANQHPLQPAEIQIDCDWTTSTSKKYFQLLKTIKSLLPDSVLVSATIRLHQYKYPSKTGVPPVDRGMLMVYNINDPKKYETTNSIFDYGKAKAYFTSGKEYPLPLDIALPAYSWSLIFRDGKFYQVESNLSGSDVSQLSFLQKEKNGFYHVKIDTVFEDVFLRTGDEIKPEGITKEALQQAAQLSQKAVNSHHFSVALFELSRSEIKNYSHEDLDALYRSYR